MPRIKVSQMRAAAAAALLSLSLAAPAFADHRDRNDDHHRRRGYPVHVHGRSCDRDHHRGGDWNRRSSNDWNRGGYFERGHRGRDGYYRCACGKRWRDDDKFFRHMRRHHDGAWFRGFRG